MNAGEPDGCRACGARISNQPFLARAAYFGSDDAFPYVECETCGSIQIVAIPADLAGLYPPAYRPAVQVPSGLGRLLRRQRAAAMRGSRWNLFGRLLLRGTRRPDWADWMKGTNARLDSRILDVGSSDGELLIALGAAGYRHLTGIDPFIKEDLRYSGDVRIFKRAIEDHEGEYDVVMLHHSLEHIADPTAALRHVHRLLDKDGTALVRIPVAGNYGWRTYREHWRGLEPPRHLTIPSAQGMAHLADRAGLRIVSTIYDGKGGYHALSEQNRMGKPPSGERRDMLEQAAEIYEGSDLERFRELAEERNRAGDGDTAAFYLRPA